MMMDFIGNWFKNAKGFIYLPDTKEYVAMDGLQGAENISVYPRMRKRNSSSDIKLIPGIVTTNDLLVPPTWKNGDKNIYLLDSHMLIESKATERAISKLLDIDFEEMKLEIMDLSGMIKGSDKTYTIEELVTLYSQPTPDIVKKQCEAPKNMELVLKSGYASSPYGREKMVVDITIVQRLLDESYEPEQIAYIMDKYLELDRMNLLGAMLSSTQPRNAGKKGEYLYNGIDGIYYSIFKKDKYESTKISNFTLHPDYTVSISEDEILHCTLKIEGEDSHSIKCSFKKNDLMGWKEFIRAIPSNRVLWLAKDREVQLIRGWIHDLSVPNKKGVDKVGLHNGRYILANGSVYNGSYIRDDDFVYSDPYKPTMSEKDISQEDFLELAKDVLPSYIDMNDPSMTRIALAWFFSSPLSEIFREVNGNFPLLQVWGTKGSGKTTLASMFSQLFGTVGEPKSCNRTPFSLLKDMSMSNAIPVVMDEYKPGEIQQQRLDSLHYSLRMCYNGMQDTRGRADFSIQTFTLTTPVVISGEMPFIDPALTERAIILNLRPQYVKSHPHSMLAYNKLLSTDISAFLVGYLKWITSKEEGYIEENIRSASEKAKKFISKRPVPLRVMQNISSIIFGVRMMNEVGSMSIDEDEVVDSCLSIILDSNVTDSLDRFMGHLNDMVVAGYIGESKDYFVSDGKLHFATDPTIARYSQYCQQHGLKTEMVNRESIRQMLLEMKDTDGYVEEPYGKVYRMKNGRSVRCTVISLKSLESTTGINHDSWQIDEKSEIVL